VYFLLLYDVVPDYLERRAPLREAHLKLATQAHARGELLLPGALPTRLVAERFARSDPYVIQGLVREWKVRQWNVVVGGK